MLFVHETHSVVGKSAEQFEAAYRDGWMPALAAGSDARLLWYFDLAHGTGLSYRVVTVTAVDDGAILGRVSPSGWPTATCAPGRAHRDGLQHSSTSRVLTPLGWSPPIGALSAVPGDPVLHEPVLYMEDTMWPFPGKIRAYIEASGTVYRKALAGTELADAHVHRARAPDPARRGSVSRGDPPAAALRPPAADPAPHQRPPAAGGCAGLVDARGARTARPVAAAGSCGRHRGPRSHDRPCGPPPIRVAW